MKNVLYIGNKLQSSKHNISYISVLGPLLESEGINVQYASSYQNKYRRLWHMANSIFKLRSNLDVVLIDTYSTQNFYYAYVTSQLCRFFDIPYVPILHGGNLISRLKNSVKKSNTIFKHSKINIAPSTFMQEQFKRFGYNNVVHIPNVLELHNYEMKRRSFDFPRLLWVRSFSKIYNPELAIETFSALKKVFPNTELCMVGPDSDGSLEGVKKFAEDCQLEVKFTGKLSKQEWIELSRDYNIFMNTSNFDNMPLSVIEAMALGIPIVSTNVGGMPFLIDDGVDGILVPANDSDAMANAIKNIIDNPEKTKLKVEKARRKIEQFDWHRIKSKWLDVLEDNIASS